MSIRIYTKEEANQIRKAGHLAARILDFITPYVQPGISTLYLNDLCEGMMKENGAIAAPIEKGFPKAVCTSVNEVVCHGIPSDSKILKEGDIINIDVSLNLNGWYGDTSRTFMVGNVSKAAENLVRTTYSAMMQAIKIVKPGVSIGDIGFQIEKYAKTMNYSIVKDYCGHGIGASLHEEPSIFHYGKQGTGIILEPGMCFTIEPMINIGLETTRIMPDGWTVKTKDNKLSCQFEHQLYVTEIGYDLMTS